jgi:cytochrome oxidase Cu insertion factor (SCO1/SenC/PrrC family)
MARAALLPVLLAATSCFGQQTAADRARLHPPAPQNANMRTGPEVGNRIPSFDLIDQNGKHQTLASLRGPKGLVLAFIRSADW